MLDGCILHPEVATGVSGIAQAHGLHVEDVYFKQVAGDLLLKPGLVPSPLCFAWFYQSSCFINMDDSCCNTIDIAYSNYSSDDTYWQAYLAINIIEFTLLAVLTQNQLSMRYKSDFPILPHNLQGTPRSMSQSNPPDGFTFARGRTNPDCLP